VVTAYRYRVAYERLVELANAVEPDVREAVREALAN